MNIFLTNRYDRWKGLASATIHFSISSVAPKYSRWSFFLQSITKPRKVANYFTSESHGLDAWLLCFHNNRRQRHCDFWFSSPSIRSHPLRGKQSLYLVEGFQWNLPQIFIVWVGSTEKIFSRRSGWWSYAYKCANAI